MHYLPSSVILSGTHSRTSSVILSGVRSSFPCHPEQAAQRRAEGSVTPKRKRILRLPFPFGKLRVRVAQNDKPKNAPRTSPVILSKPRSGAPKDPSLPKEKSGFFDSPSPSASSGSGSLRMTSQRTHPRPSVCGARQPLRPGSWACVLPTAAHTTPWLLLPPAAPRLVASVILSEVRSTKSKDP